MTTEKRESKTQVAGAQSLRLPDRPRRGGSSSSALLLCSLRFLGGDRDRRGEAERDPFRRRGGLRLRERESERLEPLEDLESDDFDRERERPELEEELRDEPLLESESESELDDEDADFDLNKISMSYHHETSETTNRLRFFCLSFSLSSRILSAIPALQQKHIVNASFITIHSINSNVLGLEFRGNISRRLNLLPKLRVLQQLRSGRSTDIYALGFAFVCEMA